MALAGGTLAAGPVYTSADSGATWVLRDAAIARWSSVVSSADGGKVVAAVYGGGFYTGQSTPTPLLSVTASSGNALLSWIVPSMEFTLQANPDLTTTNWTRARRGWFSSGQEEGGVMTQFRLVRRTRMSLKR